VHIYILGPKQLRWNSLQISQLSIRSGAHKLFADFWTFHKFDRKFAKIVAPPSDENENDVVLRKAQFILKSAENRIKIDT